MAYSTLDTLPIEVLQTICELLDASHKPSVAIISLVNWQWHRAARFILFRGLTIRSGTAEQLLADTERWTSLLSVDNGFRHVRRLTISDDNSTYRTWYELVSAKSAEDIRRVPIDCESSWRPLVQLIESLTALRDLVFNCCSPIPLSILQALQTDQLSECRLHMPYFNLDCLTETTTGDSSQPLRVKPHEWALIISPNLHRIVVGGDTTRTFETEYHFEAIQEIISHCSPRLEEVFRKPYPGLALPDTSKVVPTSKKGLTNLLIEYVLNPKLEQWQTYIKFDTLQKLTLNTLDAKVLAWAVTGLHLPAIKHLHMTTIFGQSVDSTTTFLQSLPSLTTIEIGSENVSDVTFSTIIQHHGSTLQLLGLPFYSCSLSDLQALREACLELVDLNVEIERTQGNRTELALYDCLGSIPQLQTLTLHLDCSIRLPEADLCADPRYRAGEHDKSLHFDHTKQSLINCAVDSTLATSIFSRISLAKPSSNSTLKSASLYVAEAGTIHAPDRMYRCGSRLEIHRQFQRAWLCRTHSRDDRKGEVMVEETESSRRQREREDAACNGRLPELSGWSQHFDSCGLRRRGRIGGMIGLVFHFRKGTWRSHKEFGMSPSKTGLESSLRRRKH